MVTSTLVQLTILMTLIKYCENQMKGNVIGGKYADINNFPHAVYVFAESGRMSWGCGSSILNQWILLTAGHCVDDCKGRSTITIYAGSANVKESPVVRRIQDYILHEKYDPYTVYCDIAVMMLSRRLTLGRTMKRVIMERSFPDHLSARVAGWGVTTECGKETIHLKYVRQRVWTVSDCNSYEDVMKGTFCAASGSDYDYPYEGDSGSGLVTKQFQVIGLVSYKGSRKKDLIIYTNVSYFYSWIRRKSKHLYCSGES